jgi:hypothetical protein
MEETWNGLMKGEIMVINLTRIKDNYYKSRMCKEEKIEKYGQKEEEIIFVTDFPILITFIIFLFQNFLTLFILFH